VADAEVVEEGQEVNLPAVSRPASAPKVVEQLNESFSGIGNTRMFLPAIVLNTDGEFEFKASGETVRELEFKPLSGRDCLSYWDEEVQVFIKSYDGKVDEDGDDFSPYLRKARKMYEIITLMEDPSSDNGAEEHMIRCSPTMSGVFKTIAGKLAAKGIKLEDVTFTASPVRLLSKKHRVKYWNWDLKCSELEDAEKAAAQADKKK
jgi:hypothetical protein